MLLLRGMLICVQTKNSTEGSDRLTSHSHNIDNLSIEYQLTKYITIYPYPASPRSDSEKVRPCIIPPSKEFKNKDLKITKTGKCGFTLVAVVILVWGVLTYMRLKT